MRRAVRVGWPPTELHGCYRQTSGQAVGTGSGHVGGQDASVSKPGRERSLDRVREADERERVAASTENPIGRDAK